MVGRIGRTNWQNKWRGTVVNGYWGGIASVSVPGNAAFSAAGQVSICDEVCINQLTLGATPISHNSGDFVSDQLNNYYSEVIAVAPNGVIEVGKAWQPILKDPGAAGQKEVMPDADRSYGKTRSAVHPPSPVSTALSEPSHLKAELFRTYSNKSYPHQCQPLRFDNLSRDF